MTGQQPTTSNLQLTLLPDEYAVCQLAPEAQRPAWANSGDFLSLTRTPDELSIVCPAAQVPTGVRAERDWRVLKVSGPLDFAMVGVLASLTTLLAAAQVSIFVISTFDTDYILVKGARLEDALIALRAAAFRVRESD